MPIPSHARLAFGAALNGDTDNNVFNGRGVSFCPWPWPAAAICTLGLSPAPQIISLTTSPKPDLGRCISPSACSLRDMRVAR